MEVQSRQINGGVQVNAFTGGSGLYEYSWVESLTGTRVIGTSPNLENLPPGDYYLTLTDAVLGCKYPPQLITVGGYASVSLMEQKLLTLSISVVPLEATSTATADFIYTLDCFGETNASFDYSLQEDQVTLKLLLLTKAR